jgi:hypothetical protein
MVKNSKYSFSFTGASALITETIVIAEEFERLKDWKAVEKYMLDNNVLNKVKQATFKREFTEIKKRLSLLTPEQKKLIIQGSLDDSKLMILLSLTKAYMYLRDFIVEVVRNKYLGFDTILLESDYIKFYNSKSISHIELTLITELTAKKVKQRVFTFLEQVGLITDAKNGIILKPLLSNEVINVILDDDPTFLSVFLYSNEEIKILAQKLKHD